MRHFALSRLYLHCRENASVTDNCLEDPSPAPAAVVVARLKNWVGWLCFKWDFRLVVLPHSLPLFLNKVDIPIIHVNWLSSLIRLKAKMFPHRSWRLRLWNQVHWDLFFLTGCSCPETLYNAVGSRLLFTCHCPLCVCVRVCVCVCVRETLPKPRLRHGEQTRWRR